ncbi:MAG: hypothetical protein HKO83_03205 [Ignavibacteriaceae bacterium]|nr:hypothetical protein [Ignavibacteria bacterium]NNL20322.1 hypothetical protein [Ignavibacteriaceae bacterium]
MNLLNKTILGVFILVSTQQSLSQDCKATLKINSDREDIKIFINENLLGSGNNFQAEIELGNHIINIVENSIKWNSKFFTDTIEVKDCSEISLSYSFEDDFLLNTDPQNAYVFRGDSLIGYTPLLLRSNFESFSLQKPEYRSEEINLSEIKTNEKIKLDFIGEEDGESFYESTIFKILIGTAIALGASTAYFKLEADKRFDEYKVTGDPELLSQTDRLDIISGATFVALQINFGLIIYLFLSD